MRPQAPVRVQVKELHIPGALLESAGLVNLALLNQLGGEHIALNVHRLPVTTTITMQTPTPCLPGLPWSYKCRQLTTALR